MFRFTLYDYTNSDGTTGFEIKEPVGFDGLVIKMERHPVYKGVNFEYGLTTIEITDVIGVGIIKDAYETAGINAKVLLKIEFHCGECEDCYEELVNMELIFGMYEDGCGDYCYTKVGVGQTGCRMLWKLNEEVKVDLDSLIGFDGTTSLVSYEYLGKEIVLPSKAILFTDSAKQEEDSMSGFTVGNGVGSGNPLDATYYFHVPFSLVQNNELSEFNPLLTVVPVNPIDIDSNYLFKPSKSGIYSVLANIIANISQNGLAADFHNQTWLQVWKRSGGVDTMLDEVAYPLQTGHGFLDTNFDINENYSNNFNLLANDELAIVLKIRAYVDTDDISPLVLKVLKDTSVKITTLDIEEETSCLLYMINEVFSRIVEATTNDCMRVYSDYFGRTDAQPYVSSTDGCAALTALTKGLFIRRINEVKDAETKPVFSLSYKETFEAMSAIYNIGCVVEEDMHRAGYEAVRIEDIDYFFKQTVVLDLGDVSLSRKINQKEIYNIFKFGFERWEAEQYNGLDEFLTKREYRTDLLSKQTFEKLCKFIASGYAIEVTRRAGNDNSKDWRYDNDTFVICMKRDDDEIVVEQGGITDDENIVDPDTIYNFRISPVRNAMRWIREIYKGFKNQADAKIIFTAGDGNVYAKGKYTGYCALEGVAISENNTITKTEFEIASNAAPYLNAETVILQDLPLSYEDYKKIKANPHGLFSYTCGGEIGYGWMDKIQYKLSEGTADINLIPKF